jgi:WD40 repeat protein
MSAPFRPNAGWDLVSGGMDGFVFFWDFSRGRIRHKLDFNIGVKTSGNQMFNPPLVHSIAFPNNGRTFAVGLGDASLAIVDFNTKQIKRRLKDFHTAAVSQVHFPVFNHDQSLLLSSGNDAKVKSEILSSRTSIKMSLYVDFYVGL